MITLRVHRTAVLVAALCCAGLGGCAEPQNRQPTAVVEEERELRGLDPCAGVGSAPLARLGLAQAGRPDEAPEGPRCTWRDAGVELSLTLYTDGDGLDTLAENSEPTTARVRVAGFPALETFTGRGEFCQYDIGVAAGQALLMALTGGRPDSCSALQDVLGDVLAELPRP